tara:strand:+ start:408 stop:641 length:234 start_codon:yes stop_codon:yes gene_type:complete
MAEELPRAFKSHYIMENVLTIANVTDIRQDKNGEDYFLVATTGYFDKDNVYFMGQSVFLRDVDNHSKFKVGGKVVVA